jgi:hypothetical protein
MIVSANRGSFFTPKVQNSKNFDEPIEKKLGLACLKKLSGKKCLVSQFNL